MMSKSYWIKYFKDGTQDKGTDTDLWHGKKSWRHRHKEIKSALLYYAGVTIEVSGGNIWQKDKYAAVVGGNLPATRIARGLGVQITKDDVGKKAFLRDGPHRTYTLCIDDKAQGNHITITLEDVGSWLVAKVSRVGTVGLLIKEKYRV